MTLGPLAFLNPWMLLALLALPVIFWLLRVTPPSPRREMFPPVRLLMNLAATEETPAATPLWLLILRLALAALVLGLISIPGAFVAFGVLTGLVSLTLGLWRFKQSPREASTNRSLAICGACLGGFGMLVGIGLLSFGIISNL